VVLAGVCMAVLDVAIVNVAIPSIRADLHASFGDVELVIPAGSGLATVFWTERRVGLAPLTLGGRLLADCRLGDTHGRPAN